MPGALLPILCVALTIDGPDQLAGETRLKLRFISVFIISMAFIS
jgi:hypothetical protein